MVGLLILLTLVWIVLLIYTGLTGGFFTALFIPLILCVYLCILFTAPFDPSFIRNPKKKEPFPWKELIRTVVFLIGCFVFLAVKEYISG